MRYKRNPFIVLSLCLIALNLGACSAHYGAARITSNPPGAEVIDADDQTIIGVTPVTMWWKEPRDERKQVVLRFRKDKFYPKTMAFWLNMTYSSQKSAIKEAQLVEVKLLKKGQ